MSDVSNVSKRLLALILDWGRVSLLVLSAALPAPLWAKASDKANPEWQGKGPASVGTSGAVNQESDCGAAPTVVVAPKEKGAEAVPLLGAPSGGCSLGEGPKIKPSSPFD